MTMSPVQVERTVRQLDNDIQALYTLINGISTTQLRHTNRFLELAATVDVIDGKVDAVDDKVDALSQRADTLNAKIDALGERTDTLTTKVDTVGEKVDAVLEMLRGRSG